MKYRYIIGIDPGKHTGYAVWDCDKGKLLQVDTLSIHRAIFRVKELSHVVSDQPLVPVYVRIEDARTWQSFGKHVAGRDQGAGSVKRDCSIWEDFLKDYHIDFEMVKLQSSLKKTTPEFFKKMTGWSKMTSFHSRDAAMLVYKFFKYEWDEKRVR